MSFKSSYVDPDSLAEQTETSTSLPRRGRSRRTLTLLDAITDILTEIQPTTVRGVCYQLFARGLIESMAKNETARVSRILTEAREEGRIPWEWITDETREPETISTWSNPAQVLGAASRQYRKDHWTLQPQDVEVWSEKGTVRGALAPILDEFAVTFRVFHGFASATAVNEIATQTRRPLIALYVGDWDPSGLHMSEQDLPQRLIKYGALAELRRVALVQEDLEDLPSFNAETKSGDPRAKWFRSLYGERCWELDALSPVILRQRVRDAIAAEIDWPKWKRCTKAERAEQASLKKVLAAWNRGRQ